jgi:DNA-binding NarL/FixJ family response regulator
MIHIAVADDQILFRKGIISLINAIPDFTVIIEAENGQELLDQLAQSQEIADVILLDISMPVLNGLETLNKIKLQYPYIKNIMLTVHEEEKFIIKLIDAGANAYLAKNTEPDEVEKAVRTVLEKDFYFNENTIEAMRNGFKYNKQKIYLKIEDDITQREKEVLLLLCKEYTTPEIAKELFISERTVEGHRNNLLQKVGCKNTAGLIIFAIKSGLYSLDI